MAPQRPSSWSSSSAMRLERGRPTWGDSTIHRRANLEDPRPRGSRDAGRAGGVEKWLPKMVRLLWSQEVDDGLYTNSHQGNENQRSGHRLVSGVQVAADSEEYGAQGEQQHA